MKKILVLGIGRSSLSLLEYLNSHAAENNWAITACDQNAEVFADKLSGLSHTVGAVLDITDTDALVTQIEQADIVVSLLPPTMHIVIAKLCLAYKKHLATASYASEEMKSLHSQVQSNGLIFINEMGLDPGIDHMSAMKIIDNLKANGAEISSFESYCGGLIHEEDCKNNPWKYKFSWNPMNVVVAGQGGMSSYKEDGSIRNIPPHRVFQEIKEISSEYGEFDAYANRDSLPYISLYGLESANTFIRGTLRRNGFCSAWNVLVQLGFTENATRLSSAINNPSALIDSLTGRRTGESFSNWLLNNHYIQANQTNYFDFLEENVSEIVGSNGTAAEILLHWLSSKWKLEPNDRDQVVMIHRVKYMDQNKVQTVTSSLQATGLNGAHTAMARTVGLPLAIAVELILKGKINSSGVQIPITPNWYLPILQELEAHGIVFKEYTEG